MNNEKRDLINILPLLRRVVDDLEMLRYQPYVYDMKYSKPDDLVNPNDAFINQASFKIDSIILPIFSRHSININPVNYSSYIQKTSDEIIDESIFLYQRMNYLLDPDNF